MKKYIPKAVVWSLVFSLVGLAILLTGIALGVAGGEVDLAIIMLLDSFGGVVLLLSLVVLFASLKRCLIINEEKILLPPGANVGANGDGKMNFFGKTEIRFDEIAAIESRSEQYFAPIFLLPMHTNVYTLKLKDGRRIETRFYEYGKRCEKEIFKAVSDKIR